MMNEDNITGEKMFKKFIGSLFENIFILLFMGVMFLGFMWILKGGMSFILSIDDSTKIEHFKEGKNLICYDFSQKILVNKKYGWEIYKDDFKKEDLLIPIHKCKEE